MSTEQGVQQEKFDVFISYAHIDDEHGDGDGWVTDLQRGLEDRLGVHLGRPARIWRDRLYLARDADDQLVKKVIESAITHSHTILIVTSPHFVGREWFKKEYNTFLETDGGAQLENKSKILVVKTLPVELEGLPDLMQAVIGYEFFEHRVSGEDDHYPHALEPSESEYRTRLNELAHDIAELVKEMS